MKRIYDNLYQHIYHPMNLWAAYRKAARGKRYRPAAGRGTGQVLVELLHNDSDFDGYEKHLGLMVVHL